MSSKFEDVQYMKFDSEGNLYLYEPGAGMSGEVRRVIKFGSDNIVYADEDVTGSVGKNESSSGRFKTLSADRVHRVIPSKSNAITKYTDGKVRY